MEGYILGVSGGPDSMALLDIARRHQLKIVVCHVNYHVREDSDLDQQLVLDYCNQYKIPCEVLNVTEYGPGNFEDQARTYRYEFYLKTAKDYHYKTVLLAHHKDDFLESVLMKQARKMEDVYLGIRAHSIYKSLEVIRPLMHLYKEDLVSYCNQYHVPYRIDSTNLSSDYTRNYYRNEVLSHYCIDQKEALYKQAMAYNDELEKTINDIEAYLDNHQSLSLQSLMTFEKPVLVLRLFLNRYIPHHHMSNRMLQGLLDSLIHHPGNLKIVLPIHFLLIKEYDNIYVNEDVSQVAYYYEIDHPQAKDYGYFKIAFQGHDREGICPKPSDYPLTIRTYQKGDKIKLSYGTKKVSRLFIDAKIPQSQREQWPVVLNCHQEILLVPKIAKNKDYLLPNPTLFVIQ